MLFSWEGIFVWTTIGLFIFCGFCSDKGKDGKKQSKGIKKKNQKSRKVNIYLLYSKEWVRKDIKWIISIWPISIQC